MRFVQILSGSVAVYVMVACGEAAFPGYRASDGGSAAVTDAVAEPEGSASDAGATGPLPLPPLVATESCTLAVDAGGTSFLYAQHEFIGVSAQQLVMVRAVGTYNMASSTYLLDPGFPQTQVSALIRDGWVAAACGTPSEQYFSSVTFTLPQ